MNGRLAAAVAHEIAALSVTPTQTHRSATARRLQSQPVDQSAGELHSHESVMETTDTSRHSARHSREYYVPASHRHSPLVPQTD